MTPTITRGILIVAHFESINIGDHFESLEVIGKEHKRILVKCACGKEKKIITGNWGFTKSCGCSRKKHPQLFKKTHGQTKRQGKRQVLTPTYLTWRNMRARCNNRNSDRYPYYGGRGISICKEWDESFENFLSAMGERPPGKTLERLNVNENYSSKNCRWATKKEQARNTRLTRYLELSGERKCIATWAEDLCVNVKTLETRLRLGWSDEKILTTPVKSKTMQS
jgi:hypothetical protein